MAGGKGSPLPGGRVFPGPTQGCHVAALRLPGQQRLQPWRGRQMLEARNALVGHEKPAVHGGHEARQGW